MDIPVSQPAFADLGAIRLAYQTFGQARRPALLLIMGLGTQMVAWDEDFCRLLAGSGFFVIRFDNRDIGRSTHLADAPVPDLDELVRSLEAGQPVAVPYSLRDMAQDAAGLLDALDIPAAHVAGVSMGAMIGQEMAIHLPQKMLSLTSIMSSTGAPDLPPPTPEALAVLMEPFPTKREGYVKAFIEAYKVLSGPQYPMNVARARTWAEAHFRRGLNPNGVARQMAAITAAGDRTAALAHVKVPTLVLHGSVDPLLPPACGQATARAIPGARLEILDGMGHVIPEALWPRIVALIAGHLR
jgi:pimeloyl-ACP methyl ester carboxylesterase